MNEKIYLLTDGCMWEINKKTGDEHPHAIEVVDIETGAVRYIRSGSRIKFIDGDITDIRSQKAYEKAASQKNRTMPSNPQDLSNGAEGKRIRKV